MNLFHHSFLSFHGDSHPACDGQENMRYKNPPGHRADLMIRSMNREGFPVPVLLLLPLLMVLYRRPLSTAAIDGPLSIVAINDRY